MAYIEGKISKWEYFLEVHAQILTPNYSQVHQLNLVLAQTHKYR